VHIRMLAMFQHPHWASDRYGCLASGQHVRFNKDIDVPALQAANVTLAASNVRYQAAAAQQEALLQASHVAA
jgi:hypothetical protein